MGTRARCTLTLLLCVALAGQALAACDPSCLTCDEKTGDCLTCPARKGLDTASSPRRCKTCEDIKCIDCGRNHKKCELCAFDTHNYLAANGTCQWCRALYGPCDPEFGCRADGSCIACEPQEGYAMVDGVCKTPPAGCNATNVEPQGGACKQCDPGYVTLANGTCKACPDGCAVCTEGGACTSCFSDAAQWKFYTMVANGSCAACAGDCADCEGDPQRCRRCSLGRGGVDRETGWCTAVCDDANCYDCAEDKAVCKGCQGNYYLSSEGKCVKCNANCDEFPCFGGDCSWTLGEAMYKTCDSRGVCFKCDYKFGKVGDECKACQVEGCDRCDGDASQCSECSYWRASENSVESHKMYPGEGNSTCIVCQAHEKCTDCDGAYGKCTACAPGFGVVDGTCVKCEVDGCRDCSGDAKACKRCQQIGDNCEASFWYDTRTRACVKIAAVLDC